jgi:hypothetical protein
MAKFMLLFIDDDWDHLDSLRQNDDALIQTWWTDLVARGVLKSGKALGNKKSSMTVRRVKGKMIVFDGPFIESKEHVGGLALIEVKDRDAAIAVARTWPGGPVEVRPIVDH